MSKYTFKNNPENVARTEEFSQVVVYKMSAQKLEEYLELTRKPITEELIKDCLKMLLEHIDPRMDYQILEVLNGLPVWCNEGHKQDGLGVYVLFAVRPDNISDAFAMQKKAYDMAWIEDLMSDCMYYSERKFFPERCFDYLTWDAEVGLDEYREFAMARRVRNDCLIWNSILTKKILEESTRGCSRHASD